MHESLGALLIESARRFPDRTALVFEERTVTYQALNARSSRLAVQLKRLGCARGDFISLYGPNSIEWVVGYYAVMKIGAVVNPLNPMLTPVEVFYAMQDCGARLVIGAANKLIALREKVPADTALTAIAWGEVVPEGMLDFSELEAGPTLTPDAFPDAEIRCDDLCTISYTSGTTGAPKGALLSHRAILMNVEMTAVMHARTERDVAVSSLPCSHVYGNVVLQSTLSRGGRLVLHASFDAERTVRSIARWQATLLEGVPTMFMYLLNLPDLERHDLSTLRMCTVGGQAMPEAKMREVEARLGTRLIELWGMTELGGLGTTHTPNGPHRLGSIGVALPHVRVRIADVNDPEAEVADGEVGELQVRGPITMREYAGRPAETAQTLLPSGWLRTGDLARMDKDGFVFVVDRLKDMIITAGFNVYPAELERVIAAYPAVAMVAVGPVADESKGELAKAYVVLRPGSHLDVDALEVHCRQHLAAYKVPRAFQVVSDLPKTSTGKIMRRALRALDL